MINNSEDRMIKLIKWTYDEIRQQQLIQINLSDSNKQTLFLSHLEHFENKINQLCQESIKKQNIVINDNFRSSKSFENFNPKLKQMNTSQRSFLSQKSILMSSSQRFFSSEKMNQLVSKEIRSSTNTQNSQLTAIICLLDYVIVGTSEGQLQVYDQMTFDKLFEMDAHSQGIKVIKNGLTNYFATGSLDKSIKIFMVKQPLELILVHHLIGHNGCILDLIMVQSGLRNVNLLYSSSGDNTVGVWDMDTGYKLMSYSGHHSDVHAIGHSRKLDLIVSGSNDKSIRVWSASNYKVCRAVFKMEGHTDSVMGLVIPSEDESLVVSCSLDKTIRVWNLDFGSMVRVINCSIMMNRMVYIQPGCVGVMGFNSTIDLYDYAIGVHIKEIKSMGRVSGICIVDHSIYSVEGSKINIYN